MPAQLTGAHFSCLFRIRFLRRPRNPKFFTAVRIEIERETGIKPHSQLGKLATWVASSWELLRADRQFQPWLQSRRWYSKVSSGCWVEMISPGAVPITSRTTRHHAQWSDWCRPSTHRCWDQIGQSRKCRNNSFLSSVAGQRHWGRTSVHWPRTPPLVGPDKLSCLSQRWTATCHRNPGA